MDPIMEVVVEIFRRQMVPMVITICINKHLLMKHRHHHLFLIIYKLFLDLLVNLRQLQIIRTVWMPIIKSNNIKIWSTGKWKREKENNRFFLFMFHLFSLKKTRTKKNRTNYFFFLSFLDNWSFFFSSNTFIVSSNVKIDRLLRCYYSVLLIEREDEQLLFHLCIDDNDEKVVGPNHLRAYCIFLFCFNAALLLHRIIDTHTQL
jgi:hypothetical protein